MRTALCCWCRVVEEVILLQGGCIGYVTELSNIMADVAVFKPTYFAGVPRIFERVYGGVLAKVRAAAGLPRALCDWLSAAVDHPPPPLRAQVKLQSSFAQFVFASALQLKAWLIKMGIS